MTLKSGFNVGEDLGYEIKVEVLLKKGAGNLEEVFSPERIPWSMLYQWIPKHQTAFDSNRVAISNVWKLDIKNYDDHCRHSTRRPVEVLVDAIETTTLRTMRT